MGFKSSSSATLFLSLNLLFFACALASEYDTHYNYPKPTPSPAVPTLAPTKAVPTLAPTKTGFSNLQPADPRSSISKCPKDTLKIGACAKLLNGPIDVVIGHPPSHPCCALIEGLVDAQVDICLCAALKANVIGIKLDINVALRVLLNTCGKKIPPGIECA